MTQVRTDYLDHIFYPGMYQDTVQRSIKLGRALLGKYQYDAIAFQGNSGSAIAYILGYVLQIPLINIRKEREDSHFRRCRGQFEGFLATQKYIIVDDFYSTGGTIKRIISEVKKSCPDSECVALLMYSQVSERRTFYSNSSFVNTPFKNDEGIPSYSSLQEEWTVDFEDNIIPSIDVA